MVKSATSLYDHRYATEFCGKIKTTVGSDGNAGTVVTTMIRLN